VSIPDEQDIAPAAAAVPAPRPGFGAYLAEGRTAKGLSLDDVAHLTKIRRGILEALEAENRRVLPEKVFILGYVKTYANIVGLPQAETLRRFAVAWGDDAPRVQPPPVAEKPARSWGWLPPTLAAGLFLVVAGWVASL
jgi:cytoskeletal protein RodZ